MKKLMLSVMTFLTGMLIGYSLLPQRVIIERCEVDHSKDYQAACILSDICRTALDDEDLDAAGFEDLYWDTILNLDCDSSITVSWQQIDKDYYWMY